jgi:hypothetical protein
MVSALRQRWSQTTTTSRAGWYATSFQTVWGYFEAYQLHSGSCFSNSSMVRNKTTLRQENSPKLGHRTSSFNRSHKGKHLYSASEDYKPKDLSLHHIRRHCFINYRCCGHWYRRTRLVQTCLCHLGPKPGVMRRRLPDYQRFLLHFGDFDPYRLDHRDLACRHM